MPVTRFELSYESVVTAVPTVMGMALASLPYVKVHRWLIEKPE